MRNLLGKAVVLSFLLATVPAGRGEAQVVLGGAKRDLSTAPKTGPVTVRVTWPNGEAAGGVSVVAAGARRTSDAKGVVTLPEGAPAPYRVVAAEAVRKEGGVLGMFSKTVKYAVFGTYEPRPGQPVDLALRLAPLPEGGIDNLCMGCHPDPKVAGVIPGVKCVHKSGVPLKPALAGRVAQYNRENEQLRKDKKEAWGDIRLRPGKKGWFGGQGAPSLMCESCHTVHVETGVRAYAVAPFTEKSTLCRGCHV
jgi:hypothetical protein